MTTRPRKSTSPSLADLLKGNDDSTSETEIDNPDMKTDNHDMEEPSGNPDGVSFSGTGNVIDKTPAELSAETADETAARYNISSEIPDDVANDPNVQVYADNKDFQIQGGTHVHPDIAKDNYNRAVGSPNNSVMTTRTVSENVYAGEAELDDKGRKDVFDRDEDYDDGEGDEYATPIEENNASE